MCMHTAQQKLIHLIGTGTFKNDCQSPINDKKMS
jgi:hypothetical protein